MTIEDAYKIVEEYYENLYVCETESNYENYNLDIASEKKQLEKLVASNFKNTEQNKKILDEIQTENENKILCEAVQIILNNMGN